MTRRSLSGRSHLDRDPPGQRSTLDREPPDRDPLNRDPQTETFMYGNGRAVRILLECILVPQTKYFLLTGLE